MDKKIQIISALLGIIVGIGMAGILTGHMKTNDTTVTTTSSTTTPTTTVAPKSTIRFEIQTEQQSEHDMLQMKTNKHTESEEIKSLTTTNKVTATIPTEEPTTHDKGHALLDSYRVDDNYGNKVVRLSDQQLKAVAGLVMGEMGGEGYIGCCLAAQAIKDGMIYTGCYDVYDFKNKFGYTASIKSSPNQDSINAVNYVFIQGGYAVKHRILYMYSSDICSSSWHESQKFIVEFNKERYFDKW